MCDTRSVTISRRRFLALSASFTIAACSSDGEETGGTSTGDAADTTTATSASAPSSTTSTVASTTTVADTTTTQSTTTTTVELEADPFLYGVASGDPDERSVVLWTRLGGDLGSAQDADGEIPVDWTFRGDSGDEITGTATTDESQGYSLHVVAQISEPGTFSFGVGGFTSPSGRTAPIDPAASEFRIATASCQNYQTGRYAAHRDIAEWSPDLVIFLGDFIYERGPLDPDDPLRVRDHESDEVMDLPGYRGRYGTYLSDPQLQASRAAAPWLAIWDDHEVENDYAGLVSQNDGEDPASFAKRRAQAYQAWWENTPTRLAPPSARSSPDEPYVIYRGIDVGRLVRISALDGRQYRSPPVSRAILDVGPPVEGWDDPARTMLGDEQERWIAERFESTTATWNCLAQQTILSDTRLVANGAILNYDQWDGYHPARERLLANAPDNLVTVTGDIHLAGVGEIGPIGDPVGIEFVTTAISSPANIDPALTDVVLSIPSIVDAELVSRGYTRHTITREAWTAEYRQVADITSADSPVKTWKTFRVDAGSPAAAET